MKNHLRWHRTPLGRVICFLGSVELAVPVMFFVAIALAWGTYLESTAGTKEARATVYAAWWFIALMGLVCVSLVFAVVTRYPWKKKHVGFITVHAGLITIIAGGFWSLFGRIEGQLPLSTGMESAQLQLDQEQIEILHHDAGHLHTAAVAPIEPRTRTIQAGGMNLHIVGRWINTAEETFVANDSPHPMRAIEITTGRGTGAWVGESGRETTPAQVNGLRVRVLPAGEEWVTAPTDVENSGGTVFMVGEKAYAVSRSAEAEQEAVPGWTIVSVKWFERAMVTSGGIVEGEQGRDNPAVEVVISDGQGSVEQHRAFAGFPDMLMMKQLEGEARSGARLMMKPVEAAGTLLVVHGAPPALKVSYIRGDGTSEEFTHEGALPWTATLDGRQISILQQFTNARAATRMVEAPKADGNRPALLVKVATDMNAEPVVLPWRGSVPLNSGGASATILRYGPALHELPFAVRLEEFRKKDYPGTETAMAYESDVLVTLPDGQQEAARIYMNNPFKHGGWKVYQSGFMGTEVSIFSIMRDPGLPLTYLGCLGLCIGIVVTFYSRAYSSGHPGIPVPFARKEQRNVARPDHHVRLDPVPASAVAGPVSGGAAVQGMDSADGFDSGAGIRAGDAAGHLRQAPGGATDRALEVVGR